MNDRCQSTFQSIISQNVRHLTASTRYKTIFTQVTTGVERVTYSFCILYTERLSNNIIYNSVFVHVRLSFNFFFPPVCFVNRPVITEFADVRTRLNVNRRSGDAFAPRQRPSPRTAVTSCHVLYVYRNNTPRYGLPKTSVARTRSQVYNARSRRELL